MSLLDPQYYDAVMNPTLCRELGWYAALHRAEAPLEMPTREAWEEAAKAGHNATGVLTLTCTRCGTQSSPCLSGLQQGHGMACFCSGSMSLLDPQYYDAVMNPTLCRELGWYAAFHRAEGLLEKPTREAWEEAAKAGNQATGVLTLTCTRCGTQSSGTRIYIYIYMKKKYIYYPWFN